MGDSRKLLWSNEDFEMLNELGALDYAERELIDAIKSVISTDLVAVVTERANWAGEPGFKIVDMSDEMEAFCNIYPSYDCTFNLYKEDNKLYAVVSSHDIPTGSVWYFEEVKEHE